MDVVAGVLSVMVAALPIAAVYRLVCREERKRERTATQEMWERSIAFYQNEAGHRVKTVTRERSSLRDCAPSASNHTRAGRD